MMKRRIGNTWILATFAFVSLAATAFAQVHVPVHSGAPPILTHTALPQPSFAPATMRPMPTMSGFTPLSTPDPDKARKSRYVGKVRTGEHVPLAKLPPLPRKTSANTVTPPRTKHGLRFRPMAATGVSMTVTAAGACTTSGTLGTLYNVGCQLTIQAQGLTNWSGSDTYQYYYIAPNSTTAVEYGTGGAAGGCAPVADPWTPTAGNGPSCSGTDMLLSVQGTYFYGVYDTVTKSFVASVYVNAGQTFNIQVFSDPFHTQESYQFDTVNSSAAYIYLQNVAPSDYYVTYVMSTGVNSYCVYMTPAATPGPPSPSPRPSGAPNTLVCNPSTGTVTGVQAPGGTLSVTWQFDSALEAGTYQVIVYDQTANVTLGSVQVSLTGAGGVAILTQQTTPNPNPSPGFTPSSTNILSWDSATEQSVGGIFGQTQQVISPGVYSWTMTDPSGKVVGGPTSVTVPSPNGATSSRFSFSAITTAPGYYPSKYWALQLYYPTLKKVIASQSFEVVGYHLSTQFTIGGVPSQQINFATTPQLNEVTANITFTNDSSVVFNGAGDSISGIEFTTGADSSIFSVAPAALSNINATYGTGTEMVWTAAESTTNACLASLGGCASPTQITDSAGGNWTSRDYCTQTGGPQSMVAAAESVCLVTLTPASGVVLAPGASITITGMQFWANGGATNWGGPTNNCYNAPCTGLTTILPTHGIDWSLTNNKTAPTAWTPVQFGSVNSTNAKPSGTAQIDYIGSTPGGPAYAAQANPANPWTGGHFYQANFSRADYQNSTPWTPTTTRKDALSILIQNDTAGNSPQNEITNGTSYVLAVGFPSYISTSLVALDAASTATWQTVACPTNGTFGSTYLCYAFKTNGTNIAGCGTAPCTGGSQTIVLDLPLPVTSFDFQDLTIQAYLGNEFTWFTLGANATKTETVYNGQGGSGGTSSTVDSLGLGAWSLNSNLMSAAFTPSTAGSGQTNVPLSIAVSNTSNGADPNPDAIDAVVIETQGGTAANYVPSAESVTGVTGWSYLGNLTSTTPVNPTRDYWFGVCPSATAGWFTAAGGPPQSNGVTIPLTAQRATRMASCGANEANSLGAWTSATLGTAIINLTLAGPFSTNQTFYMYAHGANGGGWSAPKAFTLNVTSESASAGFSAVGATPPPGAVATNALPTINGSPNYFTYTVKNTSAATKINKIFVTLPAFDINGLAAQNGSAQWKLVTPLTSTISFTTLPTGQVGTWGCSYNTNGANTFNPVPGVSDGQIEIDCTTGIPAGDSLLMTFEAQSPGIQSDTYAFPSKLETTSGVATGPTWIGDQDIQESFSVGLTVVVNPSNPGAGGSTPTVSCSQCAFSGSTIDFGAITAGNAVPGSDVVRASVIYSGSTVAANWTLTVQTNLNPACTGTCQGTNELLTGVDQTASNGPTGTGKCGAIASSIGNNTYHVVPTASALTIATGPETKCVLPNVYDVIQNMEVSIGSENAIGRTATVTYTLIP